MDIVFSNRHRRLRSRLRNDPAGTTGHHPSGLSLELRKGVATGSLLPSVRDEQRWKLRVLERRVLDLLIEIAPLVVADKV
jgi:hypothetical protein